MIEVKIISQRGQSALVEYFKDGKLCRVTVPAKEIIDGQINAYNLNMGIPYGLPWAQLIPMAATSKQLEQNLRRVGVWTKEDALSNAPAVLGAIQATYQIDLGTILRIAKEAK